MEKKAKGLLWWKDRHLHVNKCVEGKSHILE
jgi:hypothetical protein